jgi:hypothetical protein
MFIVSILEGLQLTSRVLIMSDKNDLNSLHPKRAHNDSWALNSTLRWSGGLKSSSPETDKLSFQQ